MTQLEAGRLEETREDRERFLRDLREEVGGRALLLGCVLPQTAPALCCRGTLCLQALEMMNRSASAGDALLCMPLKCVCVCGCLQVKRQAEEKHLTIHLPPEPGSDSSQ